MQGVTAPLARPRPARWTRGDYAAMAEAGVFVGRRVQLLDGKIVEMPPMLNPQVRALRSARKLLEPTLPPLWVLEISDTTLGVDRGRKRRIYARAGVSAYWVLDLNGRALYAYSEPVGDDYGALLTYRQGAIALPWAAAPISFADLLP
jgi:Uma2 family endonuclease